MIKNYFFFLFIGAFGVLFSQDYTATKAKKVPNSLIIHGDTLIDNYYWMRDKYSPEVINHLYAENAYADNVMKESSFLQKVLYEEMKSRRKESYTSRPSKDDGYWYYQKQEKGKNYSVSYRKKDTLNAKEQLILDPNTLTKKYEYISINNEISPDNK